MTPGIISNIHRGIVSLYINSVSTPPGVSHYSRLNNVCALTHKIDNDNYPCLCLCFGFSQITITRPLRLIMRHLSHIGLTDGLTFILIFTSFWKISYLCLNVIRPRVKSYGDISTVTLSPGKMRM